MTKLLFTCVLELLRESRLSLLDKRKVQESIQKGEPLPFLRRPASADERISSKDVMMRPKYVRRRPKELIVKSGAYEMDTFVPSNYKCKEEIFFIHPYLFEYKELESGIRNVPL